MPGTMAKLGFKLTPQPTFTIFYPGSLVLRCLAGVLQALGARRPGKFGSRNIFGSSPALAHVYPAKDGHVLPQITKFCEGPSLFTYLGNGCVGRGGG